MAYAVADSGEVEGRFKKIRAALGLESFGINEVYLPPGFESYPDHDELETGHDEIFYCLSGRGSIRIDGEDVELRPGRYVWVTPEAKRKLVPGDEGMTVIVVGAGGGAPKR